MKLSYKILLSSITFFLFFLIGNSKAQAGSFYFSPANANLIQGCINEVVVMVDTAGANSNAADIEITYNPAQIQVLDSDLITPGVQVIPGNAYQAYVYNNVTPGVIKVAAGSFIGDLNGVATLLKIQFQSIGATVSSGFTINFTGPNNTLDSNIAETTTSDDLLTSVTNGFYTFSSGSCIADTTPPTISFTNPVSNASGVGPSANLVITLSDNQSGVDIDSVVVTFNGVPYQNGDAGFNFTGSPGSYVITITPVGGIPQGVASTLVVQAKDLAGNSASRIMNFNIPAAPIVTPGPTQPPVQQDTVAPIITPEDPQDGSQVEINTNLNINITDDASGVNLGSLILILNGKQYKFNSPQVSYSGDPNNYTFILDPESLLPANSLSYLTIFVKDNAGNASIKTISFGPDLSKLPDTDTPDCLCPTPTSPLPDSYTDVVRIYQSINTILPSNLKSLGLPGFISALLALLTVLAMLSLLKIPDLLLFLFTKGNNRPWGVVYQEDSGEPVAGAKAILKSMETEAFIEKSVTDFQGRYQFDQPAGDYMLHVSKNGFGEKELGIRHEINSQIDYIDLAVDNTGPIMLVMNFIKKIIRFIQKQHLAFASAGLVLSVISYMFVPTAIALLLAIFYSLWILIGGTLTFLKS